ncbi:MAG: hypothetical protein ACTSR8_18975 [Promethearchaeota archaeon]
MFLVLTYFNTLKGPEIIFSYPEDLEEYIKAAVKKFFIFDLEQEFYEFFIPQGDLKALNLYFEVPSEWARGNSEMLILTIITEKQFDSKIFYEVLKNTSMKALSRENIYKSFYKYDQAKRGDPEIKEKFDELKNILLECASSCQIKKREAEIMEMVASKGLTFGGAIKVFGNVITEIISALLQQKEVILYGDKQASDAVSYIFSRIFQDILNVKDNLKVQEMKPDVKKGELIVNTHFGLIENGKIDDNAHSAINRYIQEVTDTPDNDAAILLMRQRISILIKVADLLENSLKSKKSLKRIIKEISSSMNVKLKIDELYAVRLILKSRGSMETYNKIIVSKLDKF